MLDALSNVRINVQAIDIYILWVHNTLSQIEELKYSLNPYYLCKA